MAKAAADALAAEGRNISKLLASPLQRTRESIAPIERQFSLEANLDERFIEPWNRFKGLKVGPRALLKRPSILLNLYNPRRPSWGEPYVVVAERMRAAIDSARDLARGHEVVVHDPLADPEEALHEYSLVLDPQALDHQYDLVVLAVSHAEYLDMGPEHLRKRLNANGVLADLRGVLDGQADWTL